MCEPKNNMNARLNKTVFTSSGSSEQGHKATASRKQARKYVVALHLGVIVLLSMALVSVVSAQQGERQAFGSDGLFSYVPPMDGKSGNFRA